MRYQPEALVFTAKNHGTEKSGLLGSIAGTVIGSYIAQEFFADDADSSDIADDGDGDFDDFDNI
jgi:hypothetical protein